MIIHLPLLSFPSTTDGDDVVTWSDLLQSLISQPCLTFTEKTYVLSFNSPVALIAFTPVSDVTVV